MLPAKLNRNLTVSKMETVQIEGKNFVKTFLYGLMQFLMPVSSEICFITVCIV